MMNNLMIVFRKSPFHIWSASQHNHVVNRHLRAWHVLRNKRYSLRNLSGVHLQEIFIIQYDFPAVWCKNFVEAFQHRTFSNAVVTQNRQKLSRVHFEVHVFENRRPAFVVVGKFFNAQHFRSPPLNRR